MCKKRKKIVTLDIFTQYNDEKKKFNKDLEELITRLNKIYHKNVKFDSFTEYELFELYLENKKNDNKYNFDVINNGIEVKTLIFGLAINVLTIVISMNLFNNNSMLDFVKSVGITSITSIILLFIFWLLQLKPIEESKRTIEITTGINLNIDFVKCVIEKKYKFKEQ